MKNTQKTPRERYVSRRAFAKMVSTSHGAVNKACVTGKIDLATNKVDLMGVNTRAYIALQKERILGASTQKPVAGPRVSQGAPMFGSRAEGELGKLERQCKRLDLQNARATIENQRVSGEFLEKDAIRAYFSRWYEIEKNMLLGMGDRIYSDLMSVCGVNDASKGVEIISTINREAQEILAAVYRNVDEFVDSEAAKK
jgi:hypothetical protein